MFTCDCGASFKTDEELFKDPQSELEGKFYLRKNKELLYFNISNIYLLILFLK